MREKSEENYARFNSLCSFAPMKIQFVIFVVVAAPTQRHRVYGRHSCVTTVLGLIGLIIDDFNGF